MSLRAAPPPLAALRGIAEDDELVRGNDDVGDWVHLLICPACHALLRDKTWFVDEAVYRLWDGHPEARPALCPGCMRVARHLFEGEVILRSPLLVLGKAAALDLIYNEEERARCDNPISRLTTVEDRGDEITVLTTTSILAERIGRAFKKQYAGSLEVQHLPWEKFCRVRWQRD